MGCNISPCALIGNWFSNGPTIFIYFILGSIFFFVRARNKSEDPSSTSNPSNGISGGFGPPVRRGFWRFPRREREEGISGGAAGNHGLHPVRGGGVDPGGAGYPEVLEDVFKKPASTRPPSFTSCQRFSREASRPVRPPSSATSILRLRTKGAVLVVSFL